MTQFSEEGGVEFVDDESIEARLRAVKLVTGQDGIDVSDMTLRFSSDESCGQIIDEAVENLLSRSAEISELRARVAELEKSSVSDFIPSDPARDHLTIQEAADDWLFKAASRVKFPNPALLAISGLRAVNLHMKTWSHDPHAMRRLEDEVSPASARSAIDAIGVIDWDTPNRVIGPNMKKPADGDGENR